MQTVPSPSAHKLRMANAEQLSAEPVMRRIDGGDPGVSDQLIPSHNLGEQL